MGLRAADGRLHACRDGAAEPLSRIVKAPSINGVLDMSQRH